MSNERHAAVLLHAMSMNDREWIMGRLSEDHRAQLTPMLAELSDLGIPRQQELLLQLQARAAATPHAAAAPEESAPALPTTPTARLASANETQLKASLLQEPPVFIAAVLSGLPAHRRSELMAALAPAKAERVEARLARATAPALAEAALDLLSDKLQESAPAPSSLPDKRKPALSGWAGGWAARLRSLPWR